MSEEKRYMQPYVIDKEKIKSGMENDSAARSNKQRFGFFSIIHANTIGDEAYSKKKKIERNENGKVKCAPRGIYAKATKKGKFIDSYFDNKFLKEDDVLRSRMEEIAKFEHDERLERVKRSKELNEKQLKVE